MGPGPGGLSAGAAGSPALEDARRWRDRIERAWGVRLLEALPGARWEIASLAAELDEGLRLIDFPEVSDEDRITFLEHAVAWHVRRALRAGRFDLALELQALGVRRIARLHEDRRGWRPVLLYAVPRPDRPPRPRRPTS